MKTLTGIFRKKKALPAAQRPLPSLRFCLMMDAMGCVSYLIPILGEVFDFFWAPVSAAIYLRTFGVRKGLLGGSFAFIEELLPGFDLIPTFTITWFMRTMDRKKNTIMVQPVRQ